MSGVMGNSFDEVELVRIDDPGADDHAAPQPFPLAADSPAAEPQRDEQPAPRPASRIFRLLALTVDLSLFVALGLALTPLLPMSSERSGDIRVGGPAALVAFLLLLSIYYFVVCWMIWGRTVGAAIFDVRVAGAAGGPVNARSAVRRWAFTMLSLLTLGAGFLPALGTRRQTLADRLSGTRVEKSRLV